MFSASFLESVVNIGFLWFIRNLILVFDFFELTFYDKASTIA